MDCDSMWDRGAEAGVREAGGSPLGVGTGDDYREKPFCRQILDELLRPLHSRPCFRRKVVCDEEDVDHGLERARIARLCDSRMRGFGKNYLVVYLDAVKGLSG